VRRDGPLYTLYNRAMSEKVPPACGQCGKPSVVQTQGQGLCVDCWHKFEVARTMAFRLSAIGVNFASEQMDFVTGLPPLGPRMQVPDIPKGPPILNNIKVANSVVASINTGTVQTIDANLTYLHTAGNDKGMAALQALTEAILNDQSMAEDQKNELLDQVAFLSDQTIAGAKDRKPGVINATLSSLAQAAGTINSIAGAWGLAEPILRALFGL
jgi:hypothetical protein